ncbi:MAG: filament integrity protein FraC, partial [Cyanobacteria bacterium P01_F01_bin.4]
FSGQIAYMGEFEAVFPLKAMVFQLLFLLVAIALEAGVLRQRLRLGYQASVQYAAVINLLATVFGWLTFLIVEPLVGSSLRVQIMSYVLFNRFLNNTMISQMGWIILIAGLAAFFITLLIKLKGLELMMRITEKWEIPKQPKTLSREEKYALARTGQGLTQKASSQFVTAVLQANALSFSVIFLLLVLRHYSEGGA